MDGQYGTSGHHPNPAMWWDAAVLLVAVAAGALTMAVLAVLQPNLPTRVPPVVAWVAVAGGAVAMALADTAPTGWEPFDLMLRAAFGALVPLAASRAGTLSTSWLLLVSVVTLLIADAPGAPVAAVAAGAFWALSAAAATTPAMAALAAAAGVAPLAHLDWPVATGAGGAALALATLPVLVVGLARAHRPLRGRIVLTLTVIVVLLGLGAVAGLFAALSARTDIDRAVNFATTGIDQLGDDDDEARANLRDAAGAFASAEEDLTSWWAKPALAVPGVAQQARAVATMASAGADLARTAADASEEADVESIRPRDGRVDLDAVAALQEPLDRSVRSLRTADDRLDRVDTPLLVTPLADRLETLRREVDDALGSAELAVEVVDAVPELLGGDGLRRYFVAFQNSAELRGDGGFIGNWAEVTADGGELTLTRSGRSRDLFEVARATPGDPIEGEEEALAAWGPIITDWVNVNFTPDHPTVGRFIAQLYPRSGGAPVDGVIAITPAALSGFLDLTGPIEAPGYPEALSSENAARILQHEQYLEFPQDRGEDREAFLGDIVEILFDRLTTGELPGPQAITEALGPAVDARHLQLWSPDEASQQLFRRLGATGELRNEAPGTFGVFTQNFGGNKIDWFLHRQIDHEVEWDPDSGAVEGTITVQLRNDAPAAGLPRSVIGWGGDEVTGAQPVADGENFMQLSIYSTVPIEDVTVDGAPVEFGQYQEQGSDVVRLYVAVPSESARDVVASLRGVVEPSARYVVRALRQPTVNPDDITSTVRVTDGWRIDDVTPGGLGRDDNVALTRGNALEPFQMVVDVERPAAELTLLERLRQG